MEVEISEEIQAIFDQKTRPSCSCHWPNSLFNDVLREFIGVRLAIHRANKLTKRGTFTPSYDLFNRATMLRRRLEFLAPCRECIARYNPTGRKRPQIWNPMRARAYKEALQ